MCETCGCGDPEVGPVEIQESLLADNDRRAAHNREHFAAAEVLAINLMGSPGSGKTALLEATARRLGESRLGALSADLATDRDAERLRAWAGQAPRNSDEYPRLEFRAAASHYARGKRDLREVLGVIESLRGSG